MKPTDRKTFVTAYNNFVQEAVKGTGIFAGTLFAQAILESSGKYNLSNWLVGGSKLSQKANNFFGIKSSSKWKGEVYNIATGEYTPAGSYYVISDNFRKYPSVEASILDYIKFLQENPRYEKAGVFKAKDVKEQAERLKAAGYATAPDYAEVVNSVYKSISSLITEHKGKVLGIGTILLFAAGFFLFKKLARN
jgi:flagellum-specific peptidoglycan hydrolase FlgJ